MEQKPDFSHRLGVIQGDPITVKDCLDGIDLMTERAMAILHSVACQLGGGGHSRCNDLILNAAINAAIKEVEDIDAVMSVLYAKDLTLGQQP